MNNNKFTQLDPCMIEIDPRPREFGLGTLPRGLRGLEDFWIISDTHFGHKNIVKYAGRPDNHERLMRESWQSLVGEDDVVLHLGDIAFMKPDALAKIVAQLPGHIVMLKGNHDKGAKTYENMGIEFVRLSFRHVLHGRRILFSHYPLPELVKGEAINIHGHIHQKVMPAGKRCYNACVEHTNYSPVRLSDFLRGHGLIE